MAHGRQFVCIPSPGTLRHTGHSNPAPENARRAEDSDFLPSVSLAVVLILVFISVLMVLFQPNTVYIRIKKLSDVNGRSVQFHPLFYGQPLSTQLMVSRAIKSRDEEMTVLAVSEDAKWTLECFTMNIMAVLSNHDQSFIKKVGEHKASEAIWSDQVTRIPKSFSVAVITRTKGKIPYGVVVGPLNPMTGHFHLMEINIQSLADIKLIALRKSLSIAIELLHNLYKNKPIPDTFIVRNSTRQQFGILKIKGDPYLESGLAC